MRVVRIIFMMMFMSVPRRWNRWVFHVPKGISYAVENSAWGTALAKKLRAPWIDKDIHTTKDGVTVFGHWGSIVRNQFLLPAWFKKKYGNNPDIGQVLWADLHKLVTKTMTWRGTRRYKFLSMNAGFQQAANLDIGIMAEYKGDRSMRTKEYWEGVDASRAKYHLPKNKLVAATLPDMPGAGAMLKAAHSATVQTMVIRAEEGVPRSWAPYITWYRGKIKWLEDK